MCLSFATQGQVKDAAYGYRNWWWPGWPGAFVVRQGYYIANPQRSRAHLSEAEWYYRHQGKPSAQALRGAEGSITVLAGDIRRGDRYEKLFANVAVWNTVMKTHDYSLQKWYEFITASEVC